jgi:hypothetical protein
MVIFIAALSILGVQPGPTLLRSQPTLPYSMMWVMAIAGLVSCAVGLAITPWLSRATTVRGPVMMPVIVSLAVLGSFAAVTGFSGVVELAVFALVGVVMRKLGYSLAAMTIGLVLGATFADNLHLTQSIYGWGFITRSPLADVFLVISAVLLVLITVRGRRHRGGGIVTPERASRGPRPPHPVLEPVSEAVIAIVSIVYLVIALGYTPDAGRVPAIIAAIAAAVALFRLGSWGLRRLGDARRSGAAAATADGKPAMAGVPASAAAHTAGATLTAASPGGPAAPPETGPPGPDPARVDAGRPDPAGREFPGADPAAAGPGQAEPVLPAERRRRTARELVALGWIWAAVAASYLFGFEIGVPVVAAAYCLTAIDWGRRWQRLTFAAAVTGTAFLIAFGFVSLFHLTFTGLLT